MENGKGHNFCKTAAFELLVAFCERVMVGVGRRGAGQRGESGPGGSKPELCTTDLH